MQNLLPIVDPDIGQSIAQAIDDEKEYVEKQIRRLEKENPAIAEFISRWSLMHDELLVEVALCGVLVYRLLESQAEADKMSEEIHI